MNVSWRILTVIFWPVYAISSMAQEEPPELVKEFQKWSLGMTADEVRAVSEYGPYHELTPLGDEMAPGKNVDFLGRKCGVRLSLWKKNRRNPSDLPEVVHTICVIVHQTENFSEIDSDLLLSCLNYVRALYGLEPSEKWLGNPTISESERYSLPDIKYPVVEVKKTRVSVGGGTPRNRYYVQIRFGPLDPEETNVDLAKELEANPKAGLHASMFQGKWALGMTQDEVVAVEEHGPYNVSNGEVESQKSITFSGKRGGQARFQFANGVVSSFKVTFESTSNIEGPKFVQVCQNYCMAANNLPATAKLLTVEELLTLNELSLAIPNVTTPKTSVVIQNHEEKVSVLGVPGGVNTVRSKKFIVSLNFEGDPPSGVSSPTMPKRNSISVRGTPEKKFVTPTASIHALLIRPSLEGNAAQSMKLNGSAIISHTDGISTFGFNQEVGDTMATALQEVVRGVQLRHGGVPENYDIEFGFADKWEGKDGPSASVATALLVEALYDGFEIPGDLAVTGDLNSDGSVRPVGGVSDKIRGAVNGNCSLIGVPIQNEGDVYDLAIEENLRVFLSAKVFTLKTLDDGVVLANTAKRSPEFQKAYDDFETIQGELETGGGKALYDPQMKQRLHAVVTEIPNLLSAKILLQACQKKLPAQYSLVGTLVRIDQSMAPFARALETLDPSMQSGSLQFESNPLMSKAKNNLRELVKKSDPRLNELIRKQVLVVDEFQKLANSNAGSKTILENYIQNLREAELRAKAEWRKIINNQSIRDQLAERGVEF